MKNKLLGKFIPMIMIVLSLQSCDDFLNTTPDDFVTPGDYYKTEKQLFTALTGVYNTLSDSRNGNPLYGGDYISNMGEEADEGYYRKTPQRNIISQFLYNGSAPDLSNFWDQLYQGINQANTLLAYVDSAKMKTESNRDIIRGETLFLRGYFYFLLVNHFGNIPLTLTPTTSIDSLKIPQVPADSVYAVITSDMETAFPLVESIDKFEYGGRVSKSAVAGVLARVYLHWAGYPLKNVSKYADAKKWAEVVMTPKAVNYTHKLNPSYENVFINYSADEYDINESIWEVEFSGNRSDFPRQAGCVGNYNGIYCPSGNDIGYATANIRANGNLFKMYEDSVLDGGHYTDSRRDWAIAPFNYDDNGNKVYRTDNTTLIWGRYCGKYRREYEKVTPKTSWTPINFPLLRYSDVLLMFAEAENQLNGPTQKALDAVNLVRTRAHASPLVGSNIPNDKNDFLLFIQNERARELCFESLRREDLIRWNTYIVNMKAMVTTYENETSVDESTRRVVTNLRNISDRHLLWPIPTKELMLNNKLKQNTGW